MDVKKAKTILFGNGGFKRMLLVGGLLSCCGLSIVFMVWGFLFGFPPGRPDVEFVERVEASELRKTIPLSDGEVNQLLKILGPSAKGGELGLIRIFSGQHTALAARIREIVRGDLKLFLETLNGDDQKWQIEEIQRIESLEARFSNLDKADELFQQIEPVLLKIKELTPVIKARKRKLDQHSLKASVDAIMMEFRPVSSEVEKLISDVKIAIEKDPQFSVEGSKLLSQLAPVQNKALLIEKAGPAPEEAGTDGYGVQIRSFLRRTLNDYDSSEFVEWVGPVLVERKGEYFWQVKLTLRAKNMFGAYLLRDTRFYFKSGKLVDVEGFE